MFSPLSPLSSRETLEGRWPAVISLASGLLLEWPAGDMDAGELVFQGFTLVWHLSGNGYLHTCLSEEAKNMQKHYNLHGHSGFSWYIFSRKVYCTRTKVMLNVTHTHTLTVSTLLTCVTYLLVMGAVCNTVQSSELGPPFHYVLKK